MDFTSFAYAGEISALLAAFFWAFASHFFDRAGVKIRPVELNLLKGLLALIMLAAAMFISGVSFASLSSSAYVLIILSGGIGIGLGDTLFFKSLFHLGARKALLILTITPAMTAILARIFLQEQLNPAAWLGISITIIGVAWVITEQASAAGRKHENMLLGLSIGVLGAFFQAVGSVLSRAALTQTGASPLQSTVLRLITGVVVITVWILAAKVPVGKWTKTRDWKTTFAQVFTATFFGTFLGMWLQQISFRYSPAGIATTLSSTSPIFILPFAFLTKERLSIRAVLGACVAMVGVTQLILS